MVMWGERTGTWTWGKARRPRAVRQSATAIKIRKFVVSLVACN